MRLDLYKWVFCELTYIKNFVTANKILSLSMECIHRVCNPSARQQRA
jgi:hypothetical protein